MTLKISLDLVIPPSSSPEETAPKASNLSLAVRPSGPPHARIFILGEFPLTEDQLRNTPFTGSRGETLDKMLRESGISRTECFVTFVCPVAVPSADNTGAIKLGLQKPHLDWIRVDNAWVSPACYAGLAKMREQIALVKPKVIIALGNLAMWATTRNWSVAKWRGSTLRYCNDESIIVVPTHSPEAIQRQWSWRVFGVWDMKRALRAVSAGIPSADYSFLVRPTFTEACHALSSLSARLDKEATAVSVDIETRASSIACIGFAWTRRDAFCIPLMASGGAEGAYWTLEQETFLVSLMRQILVHPNIRVVGQNFSYDAQYIWRYWQVVPRLGFDTLLGSHILFPGVEKSLDVLSSLYCENHVYWKDDGKEWHAKMDEAVLWNYNCLDVVRTLEIAENITTLIKDSGLEEQCLFLHKVWHLAFDTMVRGVRIAHSRKEEFRLYLEEEGEKRQAWLDKILGVTINVKSPKQMKELFYDTFAQRVVLNRATKKPTTNDAALSIIAQREILLAPVVRKIQEYRSIGVFKSTFVEAPVDVDGRMRTQYNVAGPETFRFSSSTNPFGSGLNLQNVPSGSEDEELELPNVRTLFLPDEDCEIADMDLSSADLHVVVWEADEPTFKDLLRRGLDPYTEIAKEYFEDASITKKDHRRKSFKALAHGTNYIGTPAGLAGRIGLSQRDVARTQEWYYDKFPRIKTWQDRVVRDLRSTKTVHNVWGYRRVYFDRIEGTVSNQAVAWLGQSTVAILVNKIWEAIASQEPWIQVLLQVHDSLVFQYPIARAEEARAKIKSIAGSIVIPYPDPLIIPVGLKTSQISWGDCK